MTMPERLVEGNGGLLGLTVSGSLGQFDKLNAITNNYKQRDNAANMLSSWDRDCVINFEVAQIKFSAKHVCIDPLRMLAGLMLMRVACGPNL